MRDDAIIHPRPDHAPEEVLHQRELETYHKLLADLEKKTKLLTDKERRKHLQSDIRTLKSQLAEKQRELGEIEGRYPRHLLTSE